MSKHAVLALCFKNLEKGIYDTEVLLVCEGNGNRYDAKDEWRWSLSGGKCCDNKWLEKDCCRENPATTVQREFKEETGFDSKLKNLVSFEELENQERGNKFVRYVYLVEITGGQMLENKTPSGGNSPQWFKLSAIPRNLFYSHQQIIRDFFTKKPLRK